MIEQLTDGPRHRIRHVLPQTIGVESILLGNRLALGLLLIGLLGNDPPRNANRGSTGRYGLGHHRIGTDLGTRTDSEGAKHLGAGTHHNPIFKGRMPLALVPAGSTQRHALIESDIIADLGCLADHDAHAVIDKETTTDLCARMNLDPGQPTAERRHQTPQPFPAHPPAGMRDTVQPDGMQAWIASQHLKGIARRRITMEYALNVFPHTLEHHSSPFLQAAPSTTFCVSVRMPRRIFISRRLIAQRPYNRRRRAIR